MSGSNPDGEDGLKSEPQISLQQADAAVGRVARTVLRFRWLILYVATASVVIWWYEIRPARVASQQLQGTWRAVDGHIPNELLGDSYFHVDGSETWTIYPPGKSNVHRSRIAIRPANHFFIVRRQFGFDYGTTQETEYILCLKDDSLYMLRGLARLDAIKDLKIEKLRRVDALPVDARESIQCYLKGLRPNAVEK